MSPGRAPAACAPDPPCPGALRRAILCDGAGRGLGEVPLDPYVPGRLCDARRGTAQVLVASAANWSDRPSTGDALHVVIGRRACFGYAVDADRVRWFSHPRLARADALVSLADREARRLLYDLHARDPGIVAEIVWETSGRISLQRAPALPAGIDPRTRGSLERERDRAAYWSAIVRLLAEAAPEGTASPPVPGRARAAQRSTHLRGGVS